MSCVIFDFDSTLITLESLEEILRPRLESDPGIVSVLEEITNLGMAGEISFRDSLKRRLQLASPTLAEVEAFGSEAGRLITPGMADLIESLQARRIPVLIVSGGLREAILPVAQVLNIPSDHVHAVQLLWDDQGHFVGIDPRDHYSNSKIEGTKPWIKRYASPRIAVGDGMTDYHLFEKGLTDHFVAFSANIRRPAVVAKDVPEADCTDRLRLLLEQWL